MATDVQITKILLLRGESQDLPESLEPAEMAFTTDDGRLFIGLDPHYLGDIEGREDHPFHNMEILTENSSDLFAKLHGNHLKRSAPEDFYTSSLPPSEDWKAIQILRDSTWYDYAIMNIDSVTAFIDYAVYKTDGYPVRMGKLVLRHFADNEAEPFLEDSSKMIRQTVSPSASDVSTATFTNIDLRFTVAGPLNAPFLVFEYRNPFEETLNMRFRISRPVPTYFERSDEIPRMARLAGDIQISADIQGWMSNSIDIAIDAVVEGYAHPTGFLNRGLSVISHTVGTMTSPCATVRNNSPFTVSITTPNPFPMTDQRLPNVSYADAKLTPTKYYFYLTGNIATRGSGAGATTAYHNFDFWTQSVIGGIGQDYPITPKQWSRSISDNDCGRTGTLTVSAHFNAGNIVLNFNIDNPYFYIVPIWDINSPNNFDTPNSRGWIKMHITACTKTRKRVNDVWTTYYQNDWLTPYFPNVVVGDIAGSGAPVLQSDKAHGSTIIPTQVLLQGTTRWEYEYKSLTYRFVPQYRNDIG